MLKKIEYRPPDDCQPQEVCATDSGAQVRWRTDGRDLASVDGVYEVHLPDGEFQFSSVVIFATKKPDLGSENQSYISVASEKRLWFLRDFVAEARKRLRDEKDKA